MVWLQKMVNFAALVMYGARKFDHVTTLLHETKLAHCRKQAETDYSVHHVQSGAWRRPTPKPILAMFSSVHEVSQKSERLVCQNACVANADSYIGQRSVAYTDSFFMEHPAII